MYFVRLVGEFDIQWNRSTVVRRRRTQHRRLPQSTWSCTALHLQSRARCRWKGFCRAV